MNLKLIAVLSAVLLSYGVNSMADHEAPAGSVRGLQRASSNLAMEVQYAWLRPQVKRTVFRFNASVNQFASCVEYGGGILRPILQDHDLITEACEIELERSMQLFSEVDRFLYDAQELPGVYRAYRQVARAIRNLGL